MSGVLTYPSSQMATNEFVDDIKSLSLSQTIDAYSITIERLLFQLKQATPNGLLENKPFALTIVDNFYRMIPIFDKKLSDKNENSYQTNLFLETLSNIFQGLCLVDLFFAIKDSSRLEILFQSYIPFLKESYFTDDNTHDHLVNCLLPVISYSSALVSVNESNLPPKFFSHLLKFTTNNWKREERTTIINNILGLMKISAKNPLLVPLVIESGWPNACLQWLKPTETRPSYKTDLIICLILQKIARHTIGVDALNRLNCIKVLDESNNQMRIDHDENEYLCIHFIQCITYALLVEPNEIKQNSTPFNKPMAQVLEQLVTFTIHAAENHVFVFQCCHIAEILCVLSKLFVNDNILRQCLKDHSELFDSLCQLLIRFAMITGDTTRIYLPQNDEVLIMLTNLLWSISFHQCYHEKFKSNLNLMNTLSNLATSSPLYTSTQLKSIPRDLSSLKKAAEGIFWNLKSTHLTLTKEHSEQQPFVMISYSHNDSKFCRELVEHLSQHIPVWVDYKQAHHNIVHSDDVWEEIAGAMEMATVIVLIVSKEYYDSKSCRQELSYASDTLKKRIVPVYAPNQQYKANGWLGIRIAGQKYVHFGRKNFTDAFNELLATVAVDQNSIIKPKSSQKKSEKTNSLKNWTSNDVRKWFDDNHIHSDLITLFANEFHTGTALVVYAYHLKQFYQNEYIQISKNYSEIFNGKRLRTGDFIAFVDALWRLREEYDPQSKIEDAWGKYSGNQLASAMTITKHGTTWL